MIPSSFVFVILTMSSPGNVLVLHGGLVMARFVESKIRMYLCPHGTMEAANMLVSMDALDYVREWQDN